MKNGLHYSVQEKVWLAIAHGARQSDAQVFATRHSYECIQAVHRANKASGGYDLRFFRAFLGHLALSDIQVESFGGKTRLASLFDSLFVRRGEILNLTVLAKRGCCSH